MLQRTASEITGFGQSVGSTCPVIAATSYNGHRYHNPKSVRGAKCYSPKNSITCCTIQPHWLIDLPPPKFDRDTGRLLRENESEWPTILDERQNRDNHPMLKNIAIEPAGDDEGVRAGQDTRAAFKDALKIRYTAS